MGKVGKRGEVRLKGNLEKMLPYYFDELKQSEGKQIFVSLGHRMGTG